MSPGPTAATLLLLVLPATSRAATWGNPVADPEAARLSVGPLIEAEAQVLEAEGCLGSRCEAVWRPLQVGGRAEVAIVRGVALSGGLAWTGDRLSEAGLDGGRGLAGWAGLDLAVPLGQGLHVALGSRYERGRTACDAGTSPWSRLGLAGLLGWAPSDHSFALYGGPTATPFAARSAALADPEVTLTLAPSARIGGVAGLELRSAPLGLPWARSQATLTTGAEIRGESGFGGGLWIGLDF